MADNNDRIESPTRTARMNVAVTAGLLFLLMTVVFIAQNSGSVDVSFLAWEGTIGLGVALLLAAVLGGLVVTMFGLARILQLRHRAKKARPEATTTQPTIEITDPAYDRTPSEDYPAR